MTVEMEQGVKAGIEMEATSEPVHEVQHTEQETSGMLADVDIHPDSALFAEDWDVIKEDISSTLSAANGDSKAVEKQGGRVLM